MAVDAVAQYTEREAKLLDQLILQMRFQFDEHPEHEGWGCVRDAATGMRLGMTLERADVEKTLTELRTRPVKWLLGTKNLNPEHMGFGAAVLMDLPGGGKLICVPAENAVWNKERLASCWDELADPGIYNTASDALFYYERDVRPWLR